MRKLFLVRHGESKPSEHLGSDASRQLTDLGIKQIEALAEALYRHIENSPAIICSDAVRAFTTATIIARKWNLKPEILKEIYYGGISNYEKAVRSHDANENLILVGHNPDISLFTTEISESNQRFLPGTCCEILLNSEKENLEGKLSKVWDPDKF